jgi:glucosamine-6-phosphate deaminase
LAYTRSSSVDFKGAPRVWPRRGFPTSTNTPGVRARIRIATLLFCINTPLGLAPGQVRLLRGDAADLQVECNDYDAALAACGGIDLCVLGLGSNGHIAFNEPGSPWDQRTHIVQLSQSIREDHRQQATSAWEIPTRGITLGISNLLEARDILLLISGAHKLAARAALYRGVEDLDWPVTSLLNHPSVTVIELCAPERSP